ncbi:MAG: potassium-transporting ATPase subunit F [Actinomycetota bacterium]|jgi:K+-transporting ATPase KdpF subunit|nr:potassium-transporting ATPase subunit F [Nitrospiraceae bacterium]MDA8117227.1 potassium-transporting ATPase subunit F [Actinomycetota bacterium]MDA8208591.1 potassium-transporting ATPase subunit F [Actinomycetota bacterium]MDA8208830.1 potassium-transporting ATPase subunit F [Actinomycetota bacterium]MDA8374124.1 potassium-transporting ATPase subunit F [Actinomycetota bacterium]
MNLTDVALVALSILMMAYLGLALIKPEKF